MKELIAPPRVGVLAVVWRDGSVLLVRRRNPPQAGRWGFPGGRLEPGERLKTAAERELMEETGVRVRAVACLAPFEQIGDPVAPPPVSESGAAASDSAPPSQDHWVLVPVCCAWEDGEPEAADDVDDAAWFDPDKLPELLCTGVDDLISMSMPTIGGSYF